MALTEIPFQTMLARAERAADALSSRGLLSGDALERWIRSRTGVRHFEADAGNIVRHRPNGQIELAGDHRAIAENLIKAHGSTFAASPAPILIQGLDPPWLALRLLEATSSTGYSPGFRVVQADELELLDGCSLADVSPLLESDRVEWYVGANAAKRVAQALTAEPGLAQEGPVIQLQTVRTPVGPSLGASLQSAKAALARAHSQHQATIRERDAQTQTATQLARVNPADRPTRIVLIAGRFTTVLRPMAEDLAEAFRAQGCETRFITEPSNHRTLTPAAYSEAFADFDPDVVVCANHTRDDMDRLLGEHVMPRRVPWVTWVQDAMPHLLRPDAGASIGPLDLAAGHVTNTMLDRFGYAPDRVLRSPMVASERKFNPGRVDQELAKELACDVAVFTNHSETPEDMRSRLIDEVSGSPAAMQLVESIASRVAELASRPPAEVIAHQACAAIVDELAEHADDATRENLLENVALRLYDRVCRHQTLQWAEQICHERGLKLSIFGAGWENHPTFSSHARGSLSHGDELCTAYAAARLTLETTVLGLLHQRVAECALAGGLPAMLVTGAACTLAQARLRYRLTRELTAQAFPAADLPGRIAFPTYRVPEAARFIAIGALAGGARYPYAIVHDIPSPPVPDVVDAESVLGLLELGFNHADALGTLADRARDDAWRDGHRQRILETIRNRCTHASLAAGILKHYALKAEAQTIAA